MTKENANLVSIRSSGQSVSGALTIRTVDDLSQIALMMSKSGFFQDCQDAAQASVKIIAGLELGFPAFASLTGIHIIKGKPAMGANLMAAAIKRSGRYNYRVLEHTDKICRIAFFENGEQVGESSFSAEDAVKMGTQNMNKMPKNMLFARAISNGVKWYCPDIFLGSPVYTPDELGATVDENGDVIDVQSFTPAPATIAPTPKPVQVEVAPSSDINKTEEVLKKFEGMLDRAVDLQQLEQSVAWIRRPNQWKHVSSVPEIERRIDIAAGRARGRIEPPIAATPMNDADFEGGFFDRSAASRHGQGETSVLEVLANDDF